MKSLKTWNGRGFTARGDSLYVAANSRREAARMLAEAEMKFYRFVRKIDSRDIGIWDRELRDYFSQCWGNPMNGITPEKGVWYSETDNKKPEKILACPQSVANTIRSQGF